MSKPQPSKTLPAGRRTIVVLCGSTRFADAYVAENRRLTLAGHIVLSVGMFGHGEGLDMAGPVKADLDRLHLDKIDLADEVRVLNVGGYIGSSTRNEIAHAEASGKPITYLEPLPFADLDVLGRPIDPDPPRYGVVRDPNLDWPPVWRAALWPLVCGCAARPELNALCEFLLTHRGGLPQFAGRPTAQERSDKITTNIMDQLTNRPHEEGYGPVFSLVESFPLARTGAPLSYGELRVAHAWALRRERALACRPPASLALLTGRRPAEAASQSAAAQRIPRGDGPSRSWTVDVQESVRRRLEAFVAQPVTATWLALHDPFEV